MRRSSSVSTSWGNIATFDLGGISVGLLRDVSPGPSPFWRGERKNAGAQGRSMAGETPAPPGERSDEGEMDWTRAPFCSSKSVNSWLPAEWYTPASIGEWHVGLFG